MVEEVGRGLQTKGEAKIDVEFALPVDAKKLSPPGEQGKGGMRA